MRRVMTERHSVVNLWTNNDNNKREMLKNQYIDDWSKTSIIASRPANTESGQCPVGCYLPLLIFRSEAQGKRKHSQQVGPVC